MSKGTKAYKVEKPNKFVFDIYVKNVRQNKTRIIIRGINYDENIKQYFAQ